MSIDEAIARERQQAKEQRDHIGTFDDEYSKKCEVWAEEHEQIANWLEELKVIKEMDLSIPQHFTKEQSDWIKKYCINSAERLKAEYVKHYVDGDPYFDYIDEIAEQLKEYEK